MAANTDERWMRLALMIGARNRGRTWPNPAVGCVVVKDGRLVGRGWTGIGGRPHAETMALADAGDLAKAASVYVSLEPCAHWGQTPPCCDALIASGVTRVVCALTDPDDRVAGRGLRALRGAGIAVTSGVCEDLARQTHAGFLKSRTQKRPFVTLKLAQSLDGRIATRTGDSRWITGPIARAKVHQMRARHDAVMVGSGTALADDPMLDVRLPGLEHICPVRIVADSKLRLPLGSRLGRSLDKQALWLCHSDQAGPEAKTQWQNSGAKMIPCNSSDSGLDIGDMLDQLAAAGLTKILCEGGGKLAASLLKGDHVDELIVFSAGLGLGAEARASLGGMGIDILKDAPRYTLVNTQIVEPDVMSVWHHNHNNTTSA